MAFKEAAINAAGKAVNMAAKALPVVGELALYALAGAGAGYLLCEVTGLNQATIDVAKMTGRVEGYNRGLADGLNTGARYTAVSRGLSNGPVVDQKPTKECGDIPIVMGTKEYKD